MRSGHYKLTCSKSSGDLGTKGISLGQFKTSSRELPPLSTFIPKPESPPPVTGEFPHFNSLLIVKSDATRKTSDQRKDEKAARVLRHRSCENISSLSCSVSKSGTGAVEQKVRSLLMRNEAKKRPELPTFDCPSAPSDVWQAGKIVIRRPRITAAHSHSALHTLGGASDTASCMSASSGYSSSSSSSYGSFKSCGSVNSSLQRQRNNSTGSSSPGSDTGRVLFVDNPLYDITPATAAHLYNVSRSYESSLLESLSSGEFSSIDEACHHHSLPDEVRPEDPVAKECREYFEKRVQTSETFRKKWSLSLPKTKYSDSNLISKGDAVIDSRLNPDLTSTLDSGVGVESNAMPLDDDLEEFSQDSLEFYIKNPEEGKIKKKTQLDEKMEFLRHEIASLMQQDNTLFKLLLSLNESISALKIHNALSQQPGRPLTPSSLDSFTEEDEQDFEEEEEHVAETQKKLNQKELSDAIGKDEVNLTVKVDSNQSKVTRIQDDEEDEGHCTDLSLGHTPNPSPTQSPSPPSTLSSKGSTNSRSLGKSSFDGSSTASFIRCRKSYAPNARNRRRASSVTCQKSAQQQQYGTTTALVVIHTDDDLSFLNPCLSGRPRAHTSFHQRNKDENLTSHLDTSSASLIMRSLSQHSALANKMSVTKDHLGKDSQTSSSKKRPNSHKKKSSSSKGQGGKCSKENAVTITSMRTTATSSKPNLMHPPPYREALIM